MVPGSGRESLVAAVLDQVETRGDVIVIRQKSPFVEKLYRYSKQFAASRRPLLRRFLLLMRNAAVVRLVFEDEIGPLPDSLVGATPPKDRYLVELGMVTPGRTVVTTDTALKAAVDGMEGFQILLLDEFLSWYGVAHAG